MRPWLSILFTPILHRERCKVGRAAAFAASCVCVSPSSWLRGIAFATASGMSRLTLSMAFSSSASACASWAFA